jgi:hypothetical protein
MSALGHKRNVSRCNRDVRFTPESGHVRCNWDVRFGPEADNRLRMVQMRERLVE